MQTIDEALKKLQTSAFRSKFHLSAADRAYIEAKGLATIRRHAEDFVAQRLAPAQILNDGRQTPMSGHPVFVAQHACACCCRRCLNKWYKVPVGVPLSAVAQQKIVNLLLAWIQKELSRP
jgi:hypothetical protein